MSDRAVGILFVVFAIIAEALGQLAFKQAAAHVPDDAATGSALLGALRDRKKIALGVACFVVEGFLWTIALRHLDVSAAQPMAASELVIVALMSRIFLAERVGGFRWAGISLIVGGTVLIGLS